MVVPSFFTTQQIIKTERIIHVHKKTFYNLLFVTICLSIIIYIILDMIPHTITGNVTSIQTHNTNYGSYAVIYLNSTQKPNQFIMNSPSDTYPNTSDYIQINFTYMDYIKCHFIPDYKPVHNQWKELHKTT